MNPGLEVCRNITSPVSLLGPRLGATTSQERGRLASTGLVRTRPSAWGGKPGPRRACAAVPQERFRTRERQGGAPSPRARTRLRKRVRHGPHYTFHVLKRAVAKTGEPHLRGSGRSTARGRVRRVPRSWCSSRAAPNGSAPFFRTPSAWRGSAAGPSISRMGGRRHSPSTAWSRTASRMRSARSFLPRGNLRDEGPPSVASAQRLARDCGAWADEPLKAILSVRRTSPGAIRHFS